MSKKLKTNARKSSSASKPLNWSKTNGLIQSDGSFSIIFRTENTSKFLKRVVPEIGLSQKDTTLLNSYSAFLEKEGIHGTFKAISKSKSLSEGL